MRKLNIKIITFLLIIGFSLLFFGLLPIPYNRYNSGSDAALSLLSNKISFLKEKKSPKIIFIGGSNLFYGLNSIKVQESLKKDVVNMGLYGGYGLKVMINDIKPYINENDIIIIVPEYKILFSDLADKAHRNSFKLLVYNHPIKSLYFLNNDSRLEYKFDLSVYLSSFVSMSRDKIINIYNNIKIILNKSDITKYKFFQSGNIDYEKFINNCGDSIMNTRTTPYKIISDKEIINEDYTNLKNAIKEMNDFRNFVEKKNAKIYMLFSCYPEEEFKRNEFVINNSYKILQKELNIKILSSPDNYIFPELYFLDNVNHMNALGKVPRTDKIIEDLKKIE